MSQLLSRHETGFAARAAAIVATDAPEPSAVLAVSRTADGHVQVYVDATIGNLDSITVVAQVSQDNGATWNDVTSPGPLTLTADGVNAFAVNAKGSKQFRCTVVGSGDATDSICAVRFGFMTSGGWIDR